MSDFSDGLGKKSKKRLEVCAGFFLAVFKWLLICDHTRAEKTVTTLDFLSDRID